MTVIRLMLAITVLVIATYSLLTDHDGMNTIVQFLLSAMFLLWGADELRGKRKGNAALLLLTGGFILFVNVYSLIG